MSHVLPRELAALGEALGGALADEGIELHFRQHATAVTHDKGGVRPEPPRRLGPRDGRLLVAAENILGGRREANYRAVPRVVFTDPQAAAVGDTGGPLEVTVPLVGPARNGRAAWRTQPPVSQPSPVISLSSPPSRSSFVSHDPEFGTVLGDAPRLSHVVWTDAHEGPVYTPGEDALLYSSVPYQGPAHPRVAVRRLALDGLRFPLGPERISTLRNDANVANGMALDGEGRLVLCEQGSQSHNAAITREGQVLTSFWNGMPLNSPNDVVVKSDGTIWFTDPSYGHLQGFRPEPTIGDNVYRYDPATRRTTVVADGFDKPNGLCFSPGERLLYVADNGAPHRLEAFDVVAGSHLAHRRVIAHLPPGHPDGLKCDSAGRIYASSGEGVRVLSPGGDLLGEILLHGAVNFCFGGRERNVLFITADDSIWAAELAATGPPAATS